MKKEYFEPTLDILKFSLLDSLLDLNQSDGEPEGQVPEDGNNGEYIGD